jgi:hypothetical protein
MDLDAEAVELDLMLPIVTGWHRIGVLGVAGLDELEEHVSGLKTVRTYSAPRNTVEIFAR